ncbi:hypothetical protein PIB30_086898 [Stylosanthes scabra]|uniref:RNase H type-1 domain-containing protein n=1 Tax=Stylosanthes scabra TaxID=79078 RepID=A0ABU6QST0_9FABA|nr:hypothetical protein [Stylosanthes scabra]
MATSDVCGRCTLDIESVLHCIGIVWAFFFTLRSLSMIGFIIIVSLGNLYFVPLCGGFGGIETMMFSTILSHACITRQSLLSYWIPPFGTQVKLNCDASLFPNLNSTGFACVIRDSLGNWVIGSAGHILETSVLRLNFLQCGGVFFLLERMVIERLARLSCQVDGANSKDLISKIREIRMDVQLIQRSANQVADSMAKEAAVQRLPHAKWPQAWNFLLSCLAKDLIHPS